MSRVTERGAVAVEFAILAPVLIMILMGIMEFGRVYNTQATLTNAAREGVRVMALTNNQTSAKNAAMHAASALSPALGDSNFTFSSSNGTNSCTANHQMTVTITYSLSTVTGIAGPFAMTGRGFMQCGG